MGRLVLKPWLVPFGMSKSHELAQIDCLKILWNLIFLCKNSNEILIFGFMTIRIEI